MHTQNSYLISNTLMHAYVIILFHYLLLKKTHTHIYSFATLSHSKRDEESIQENIELHKISFLY